MTAIPGPDPVKASDPLEELELPLEELPDPVSWLELDGEVVVVVMGGAPMLNEIGTAALSPPRSPTAMTQPIPAAVCADVGGHG